jgi:phage tail-like protein
MAANTPPRAYSAAHFGLELDNVKRSVGFFRSIEGGSITAEVISYQMGDNYDVWRQLGKPKYEDIKLQTGMSMAYTFYAWIAEFFRGTITRRNGAIVAADFQYKEQARREFFDAQITELAFPKLDGADKSAAFLTVTLSPERMLFKPGSKATMQYDVMWQKQQTWNACNFEFTIDGFEQQLIRATKVDGFSVKQKPIECHIGEHRSPIKVPGRIEWPSVSFYVPEVDSAPIVDEYMSQAALGQYAGPGHQCVLKCKDNAGGDLFQINIKNCHIKSATPDKSDASSEEIKMVKFEMMPESMEFVWDGQPV